MSQVYRRDGGSPAEAWNALIRKVNDLAKDCPDVASLQEVALEHKWATSDIRKVEDKLKEICEDNEFDAIPTLWKTSLIDELTAAIDAGPCCCQEKDDSAFAGLDSFAVFGLGTAFKLFFFANSLHDYETFDWAGWIMQQRSPLVLTSIPCHGKDEGTSIERRTGGRGFVGRNYTGWELYLFASTHPVLTPIRSGTVTNGYINIGEGHWRPEQTCGNPLGLGTPLGATDPAWGFPYVVDGSGGNWTIHGADGRSAHLNTAAFTVPGFLNVPWTTTAPFIIDRLGASVVAFLRLTCRHG